ncbi:MAG TPA: hypothetical protein VK204_19550 [Nocardioidaceae bacterium]|nr:hypothetical protein [Nocardioidaceae bacterium]
MRKELTFEELDSQHAELLPARETLSVNVWSSNSSLAFNAGSYESLANSAALSEITIYN